MKVQASTLPVPAALLGPGEHYALEVSGDSMIEAGIFDGDFALVRRTNTARDGEIVVALVRGEEATLKYLHKEGGKVHPFAEITSDMARLDGGALHDQRM